MQELLAELKARDVHAFRHRDQLVLHGRTARVDAALRAALVQAKQALLRHHAGDGGLFEMNFCQRSMALDELFRGNLSGNSIFLPLDPRRVVDDASLRRLAVAMHRRWPLMAAAAELDGERFCWRVGAPLAAGAAVHEDPTPHGRVRDFVAAHERRARSMFDAPLAQFVAGRAGGVRCWGLWMHHAIADAAFVDEVVRAIRAALEHGEELARPPDFDFLQQNDLLARQVTALGAAGDAHWRAAARALGRAVTGGAAPLPLVDAVSTIEWSLGDVSQARLGAALRTARASTLALFAGALAAGLAAAGLAGPRVALTTFSLRAPAPAPACSGFYTTLVPFALAAPTAQEAPAAALARGAADLRAAFDHALLPLERVLELADVDRDAIVAIVNLLRADEAAPAAAEGDTTAAAPPLFLAEEGDKLRRPIKLTLVESARGPVSVTLSARLAPAVLDTIADAMQAFVSTVEQAAGATA